VREGALNDGARGRMKAWRLEGLGGALIFEDVPLPDVRPHKRADPDGSRIAAVVPQGLRRG